MNRTLGLLLSIVVLITSCQNQTKHVVKNMIQPSTDDQRVVQTALLEAKKGDTIFFGEGIFKFTGSISFEGIDSVTLKGVSHDKTIFSFKEQTEGAEGVKVTNVKKFTIEDIGIEDTKGDGIKISFSEDVVMRRIRAEWTNGPDSSNGSYGLYPVSSKYVLMEDCVAKGASDAGIYVGQSEHAIVRRNLAEYNVAGIEVENTIDAEVYDNITRNNTAGIMIFDLPDLPKKNGKYVKIFKNKITDNNQPNFSKRGIAIYMVPSGTGLLLMACQQVQAYDNEIASNNTIGTAIIKLLGTERIMERQQRDTLFDVYPSAVYVHSNSYSRGEVLPDTTREFGQQLYAAFGTNLPHIIYDGELNPKLTVDGKLLPDHRICVRNNGNAVVFNMRTKSSDMGAYDCELPVFSPVQLPN